ncbi:MAG: FUSC family protein [Desulfobacterium sp.]|nr:FUSC family protein [Desulfobacterium sp.]
MKDAIAKLRGELRGDSAFFRHAVRSAFAVVAAIAAAHLLNLHHGIWLPITVVVIMRPSLGGTIRHGWRRVLGTIIGAGVGIGLLITAGAHPHVLISLALLLFLVTFFLKQHNYTLFVVALTATVVIILGLTMPMGWKMGLVRIVDTLIGAVIGLGAAFFIWPQKARASLKKQNHDTLIAFEDHLGLLSSAYLTGQAREGEIIRTRIHVIDTLTKCEEVFFEASAEPGIRTEQRQALSRLLRIFFRILDLLTSLSTIIRRAGGTVLPVLSEGTEKLLTSTRAEITWLAAYALNLGDLDPRPPRTAIPEFLETIRILRASGEFEDLPLARRNNISAFIWNIRALGEELDMAYERIVELRYGRKSRNKVF